MKIAAHLFRALIACAVASCGDAAEPALDSVDTLAAETVDAVTSDGGDISAAETDASQPDGALDSLLDSLPAAELDGGSGDTPEGGDSLDTASETADGIADSEPDSAPEVDAQVIDPAGDSDRDGIRDLDELDDGTDPFNPRSARAWHPEIEGHPRLFVRPTEQGAIAARAGAGGGRSKALWDRVTSLAARAMPAHAADQDYDTGIPPAQSQIAEAAALVGFATGDLAMTTKALDVLAAPFPDPTPLNLRSLFNAGDHYDLHEAEALQGFCSAYDLAAGTTGVDGAALAAARDNLVRRVDYFRTLCMTTGGCTTLLRSEPNNHSIKALAALGTCAMALPDRAQAAADFNEALTAIDWLAHARQGNLEGGWAESWNYLTYSSETHLGFLFAVHHVTGLLATPAEGWSARGEGWITRGNSRNGAIVEVLDPAVDPLWRAVYERALFAAMPWGATAPVDDANPSSLHGGLLAALFDDARYIWNWELPRVGLHTGRQLVATFLASDPATTAVVPSWTDGFFADAGFSVLRSSLAETSSYLHMQHELEPMRVGGGAHEHADPLSIILAAHGTDLAIDPGYIDYSNHGKVKYGKDHNIVLVDGLGPEFFLDGIVDSVPNSDAYLHEHALAPPFTTLIASTKYGGAELRRRVVRVAVPGAPEVFVLADGLIGSGARNWTFQLNGLAGEEIGGTSFSTTPSEIGTLATWQRPSATLFAAVSAATSTASTSSRLEESAYSSGRHRCLTVDALMGTGAGFLTVLVPSLPTEMPVLVSERVSGVLVTTVTLDGGAVVEASLNLTGADVTLAGAAPRIVAPGLTMRAWPSGGAEVDGTWTMRTPPIPDPTPFLP